MSVRKVKDAKDLSTNELIYFKGHAKATYLSDGSTVEDAVAILSQNVEIKEVDGDTLDKGSLILKPNEIISFKTPLQNDSIVITGFEETVKDGLISSFDEYFLVFRTAANSTCSITLPSNIYWAGGEIPVIGDTEEVEYELSITRRKLSDDTSSYKAVLVSFKIVQP